MTSDTAVPEHPRKELLGLGIRQPWAELILQGRKTLEVRSQPTKVRGTVYIYASMQPALSDVAELAAAGANLEIGRLPRGVVLGTVDVVDCRPTHPGDSTQACVPREILKDAFAWELAHPERLPAPLNIRFRPFGVWFYPFQRRHPHKIRKRGKS
jgi:hypothetical protein